MSSSASTGHLRSAREHIAKGKAIIRIKVPLNTSSLGNVLSTGKEFKNVKLNILESESIGLSMSHNDNSIKYSKELDRKNGRWATSKVNLEEKYTTRFDEGGKHVEEYGTEISRNGFTFEDKHDLQGDGYRVQTEESLEYIRDTSKIEKENGFKKPENLNVGVDVISTDIEALQNEGSVWGDEWGSENNKLEIDALGYETSGTAAVKMENGTLSAKATADAEAYVARASYEGTYGPTNVKADASVGANASGDVGLEFNPLKGDANVGVGAEAFAGGKAEVEGGVGNDYAGVGGNAGVSYGIGAEFNADIGVDDWKVKAEFDVGATLGLGVDLGIDVELDAKKLTGWIPKTPW